MSDSPFQATEAEEGIIRAFLKDGAADYVAGVMAERGLMSGEAFTHACFRILWENLRDQHNDRKPVDFFSIKQRLVERGQLEEAGGDFMLLQYCQEGVPGAAAHYADVLREKYRLRAIRDIGNTLRQDASSCADAGELASAGAQKLCEIVQTSTRAKPKALTELIADHINHLERPKANAEDVRSGLEKLDSLSPVKRGDMPIICGEAKAGKSILAMTIAANLAVGGAAVGYASLEMTAGQQTARLLHGLARVPTIRDHSSMLSDEDVAALTATPRRLRDARLEIRDDLHDLVSLLAWGRQLKHRWPDLTALFIDYAQLVGGVRQKGDSRELEIAGTSRAFRLLSLELNVVIFLLSQLNKEGNTRESMSLEQDATAIWKIALSDEPGRRAITIPRQRNGESGIGFSVAFLGHIARVENLTA